MTRKLDAFLNYQFKPSPFIKILVKCPLATGSDLLSYDIFAPQKLLLLKISDDVIASDLWFGPPPTKNPGYAYVVRCMK